MNSPLSLRLLAALSAAVAPTLGLSQAATGFLQADAGPYDYNTTTNWVGGTINGVWDSSLVRTATQTVTFAADTPLTTGLAFGYSGDFSTTLRADGNGARTLTLGGDITLSLVGASGRSVTIGVAATPGQNLNVDLNGTRTLNIVNNTLAFANNVSNGGIIKTGAGSLFFQRPTDYAGATVVNAGTLRFDTSSAGAVNSDITAHIGTTVNFASSGTTTTRAKSVTLNGATLTGAGTSGGHSVDDITNALAIGSGGSTVTLTSNATYNERLSAGSFARTAGGTVLLRGTSLGVNSIASNIANSTNISFDSATGLLNQSGTGTTVGIIAGAYGDTTSAGVGFGATGGLVTYDADKGVRLLNTATEYTSAIVSGQSASDNVRYTTPGATTLTHAATAINSLSFDASGAAGSQGFTIAGDPGTSLKINSGVIYADFNSISGTPLAADSVTISVPTLDLNAQDAAVFVSTGGTINQQNYPARLYINSEITNGGLTKAGPGQLQLGGATSNTYAGLTTVNAGSLSLAKTGGATAIAGDIVVNGGYLLQDSNQIADTANVTVNGGQWRLAVSTSGASPKNETVATLTVNGGLAYGGNGSAATATLNVTGAVVVTNSGAINSAAGYNFNFGSLSVGNGGTVTVAAANNTTGGNLTVGSLAITNAASGAYTPLSLVAGSNKGATLILDGNVTFTGNSTNTNTTVVNSAAGTVLGRINLNGGTRTFTVHNGAAEIDLSLVPAIDNGGLVKTGLGTLELAGDNTYAGNTVITGGTLALGGSDRIANASNVVLDGGTFATRGFSETVGTLALSAGSVIDLGSGASSLVFADSSSATWSDSVTLGFVNFSEGVDSVRFGTTGQGLTGAQIARIIINGTHFASLDGNGFLALGAAIPEPASFAFLAGAGTLLLAASRRRRVA